MKNLFSKRTRIFARETRGNVNITITGKTIDLIALLAIINNYFAKRVAIEKGTSVENAKEFIYSCIEDFDKYAKRINNVERSSE